MRWLKLVLIVLLVMYVMKNPTTAAGTLRAVAEKAYDVAVMVFDGASDFMEGLAR